MTSHETGEKVAKVAFPMITAVEPRSHRTPALAISLALHGSMLLLVAAIVPAWHLMTGNVLRESTLCVRPCGLVTVRVLSRTAAAAEPVPAPRKQPPQPVARRDDAAAAMPAPVVIAAHGSGQASRPVSLSFNPKMKIVAVPAVEPPPNSVPLDNVVARMRSVLAPGNWGSRFDAPTLRDRGLYDEIVAKLPKGSTITIVVDDRGRATDVTINAPALDSATLDELRTRLLAARYAPVERDGIAFEGKLKITAP